MKAEHSLRNTAWIVCILVLLLHPAPGNAHKIMAFAYSEGDMVHVEGYFADGKKVENSLVEVFDPEGKKLLEGTTDARGVFSFVMPDVPEVKIVLTASMGHRAECTVADTSSQTQGIHSTKPPGKLPRSDHGEQYRAADADLIREILSEELDKKLTPLISEIRTQAREKPSFTEILGGIGYIAGIFGVIMFFMSRKGRNEG
ncbi:MAG: hypothetical protein ACP5G0_06015 [Desulfomonilia bacterium]